MISVDTNFIKKITSKAKDAYEGSELEKHVNTVFDATSGDLTTSSFWQKQGYIAGNIFSQGFNKQTLAETANWENIVAEEYQFIESELLNDEEEKKAREEAIRLLEERNNTNESALPDYGDCQDYYNEGSITDWILSHPVSFALDWASEKFNWECYQNISHEVLGKEGLLSLFNGFSSIENCTMGYDDTEIRESMVTGATGDFKSIETIKENLANEKDLIEKLKKNIDNPKEFSKLYYQITNGRNFSADEIIEYTNDMKEDGESKIFIEELLGRDFNNEDIGKNKFGTNLLFEVNKTVGTELCYKIPVAGPFVAMAINTGVTFLNEGTKENPDFSYENCVHMVGTEAVRSFTKMGFNKIQGSLSKTGMSDKTSNLLSRIGTETSKDLASASNDALGGNWSSAIADSIKSLNPFKSILKSIFK